MIDVHDLSDDGKTCLALGLQQQLDSLSLQTLEVIGGGAGFEGAAAQHGSAGCLYTFCNGDDLLLTFHGTGARHKREVSVTDLGAADLNDRVIGMELAVCAFVRLRDMLDCLNNFQTCQLLVIDASGVTNDADNGLIIAKDDVGAQPSILDPPGKASDLFFLSFGFDDNDHRNTFLSLSVS